MMRSLFAFLVLALLVVAPAPGHAAGADFATWLKALRAEALAKGIRSETLDRALNGLTPIKRVIELDRRQPEFTLTFDQYINRVVSGRRVRIGKAKLAEHRKLLTEIGKKYGVQPRFIVALWGIETDFGRIDGGFSVIQALATLAHDGRRGRFFRGQLIRALRILDQGHITPEKMKGSWAGAMGQFQFMPSSFEAYAVDYDGDGRRNIWRNQADAFASAANYLAKSGWRSDQTWGRRVMLPAGFDAAVIGLGIKKPMSEWRRLGVTRKDGSSLPKRELPASLVRAGKGADGPVFLVYNNYRVTLKWNRSTFFAVAVGTLAERIKGR
jgi:membrane-bound lytic murein transglycosylase B